MDGDVEFTIPRWAWPAWYGAHLKRFWRWISEVDERLGRSGW